MIENRIVSKLIHEHLFNDNNQTIISLWVFFVPVELVEARIAERFVQMVEGFKGQSVVGHRGVDALNPLLKGGFLEVYANEIKIS